MPSALFLAYFCSFTAISILFMSSLPNGLTLLIANVS